MAIYARQGLENQGLVSGKWLVDNKENFTNYSNSCMCK